MSLRYGTLPIVRETGGLKDTVIPYNEYEGTGTGFSFTNYNAHEMFNTTEICTCTVYYDKRREWNKIVDRAMAADFSWTSFRKDSTKRCTTGCLDAEQKGCKRLENDLKNQIKEKLLRNEIDRRSFFMPFFCFNQRGAFWNVSFLESVWTLSWNVLQIFRPHHSGNNICRSLRSYF